MRPFFITCFIRLSTIWGWLFLFCAPAQAQELFHRLYTTADGLPSTNIYSIAQDRNGNIWVCTDKGVARFDGIHFQTFTVKNGLPASDVWRVQEDRAGRLWLNTFNGIAYIQNNRVYTLPSPNEINKSFIEHEILGDGRHLVLFDALPRWMDDSMRLSPKLCSMPVKLVGKNAGKPVFARLGTNNVLFPALRQAGVRFSKVAFFQSLGQKTWYFQPNSNLVVEFGDSILSQNKLVINGHNNLYINDILKFSPNFLLCQTDAGPFVLDSSLTPVPGYSFLGRFDIRTAFEDCFGNCWIGTRDGLCLVPFESRKSALWKPFGPGARQDVSALAYSSASGKIWVGSPGGAICVGNEHGFSPALQVFPADFHDPRVRSLLVTGGYLFAAGSFGVVIYREQKLLQSLQKHRRCRPERTIASPEISACKHLDGIHPDSALALVSSSGALNKICFNKGRWTNETLHNGRIYHARQWNKRIWLGKMNGLFYQNQVKGNPESCASLNEAFSKPVTALETDQSGGLWIATDGFGLYRMNAGGVVREMAIPREQVINDIAFGPDGVAWAASTGAVFRIRPEKNMDSEWKIERFTRAHGLFSDETACILAVGKTLWVGSKAGVSSFEPLGEPGAKAELPLIELDAVRINDSLIERPPVGFRLSHTENRISLFFHARSYKSTGDVRCEYSLNGQDTSWKAVNGFQLDFPKLQPGIYEIRIRALDMNNSASTPKLIRLQIDPPWWGTLWARIGGPTLLILGLWAFGYSRVRQIRREERAKTRAARRMLELETRALQSQMNPHFIYNALHGIQEFIFNRDARLANQYIVRFSRLMRSFLESSYKRRVPLSEEIALLRTYVELEQIKRAGVFGYDIQTDPRLDPAACEIPPLFLQPFVENAIQHGLAPLSNGGNLLISFTLDDFGGIIAVIEDNGIGREQASLLKQSGALRHRSRGMDIVEERRRNLYALDDIDVDIEVEDLRPPERGTRVRVRFGRFRPT